jgi:hypothetical protein
VAKKEKQNWPPKVFDLMLTAEVDLEEASKALNEAANAMEPTCGLSVTRWAELRQAKETCGQLIAQISRMRKIWFTEK